MNQKKYVGFYFSNQTAGVGLYEMGYRGKGEIWGGGIKSSVFATSCSRCLLNMQREMKKVTCFIGKAKT